MVGSDTDPLMLRAALEDLWSARTTKIREGLFNIARAEDFISVEVRKIDTSLIERLQILQQWKLILCDHLLLHH